MRLTVLLAISGLIALAAESGMEMYQKAVTQERAGKMVEAIKLYEQVAHDFASDRSLAAKALVQAARGYEKLGQDGALKLYERIAREYGDQREYAQAAQAKLVALRQTATPTLTYRRIEFASGIQNVVATDGQNALFWEGGTLYYGDIGGKSRRVAYQVKSGPAPTVFPSRDLSVALLFQPATPAGTGGWAVTKTDNTGYRQLEAMPLNRYGVAVEPSWSWDNRYALINQFGQFLRVSAADGRLEELKTAGLAAIARLSPDGRTIALDDANHNVQPGNGNVYLIPADGGERQLVARNSFLIDWSRDGGYLLVAERDSQQMTLSAIPIKDGRAGERVAIRSSLAASALAATAPGGALVVGIQNLPIRKVFYSALDSNDRLGRWRTLDLVGSGESTVGGFSPDGGQIVYATGSGFFTGSASSGRSVRLHTLATGEDREVYRYAGNLYYCIFATGKRTIWCAAQTQEGSDMIAIGADSGKGETVRSIPGVFRIPQSVSPDNRFLNMTSMEAGQGVRNYWWEIGTNSETRLPGYVSADGRWVLRMVQSPGKPREIQIRPTDGQPDAWTTAMILNTTGTRAVGPTPTRFTPDGNWVVSRNADSQGKLGLYRVATSGGEPQRLGDYPTDEDRTLIVISPDNRQFIVQSPPAPPSPPEFWMLENFLPKAHATR
jgi:hypothetical protein